MHKTFTDCYQAEGFTGGGWAYSLIGNEANGDVMDDTSTELEEKEQRLAYYVIGWDTLEVSFEVL
jgi:hypothetical protein